MTMSDRDATPVAAESLTIGALARATGVTPEVLRTWEARFGFPSGRRLPSGHRRFAPSDVAQVREVLAARENGVKLAAAIEQVVRRARQTQRASVYAELTRSHPEIPAKRLRRSTMVALSRAIEEECLARTDRPLVLGAFQSGTRYDRVADRWRELARTAMWCAVFADFEATGEGPARPVLVQLGDDAPMRREWVVVCLSPDFHAVLTAWEMPGQSAVGPDRRFEAVFSTLPSATIAAARVLVGLAGQSGAPVPDEAVALLNTSVHSETAQATADRLFARVLVTLDHDLHR